MSTPHAPDTTSGRDLRAGPVVHIEDRHWPGEAAEIAELARRHLPRLLLVAAHALPPVGYDCEEDWIRLPASDDDIAARRATLASRVAQHASPPRMDGHTRVHYAGRWAHVESPIEQRLLKALIETYPDVRSRRELVETGWHDRPATANALRVHISRLNRRLDPLGLKIRGLRGHGYVLVEIAPHASND